MADATTMQGFDIYMRYTDADGKKTVRDQRVWDKDTFLAARQAEADRENAKEKTTKVKAEQITREQFLKERK